MVSFDRSHASSYLSSIIGLTMAVSGIVFEKHRDIGQKTPIFHTILPINLHDHIELHFPPKK